MVRKYKYALITGASSGLGKEFAIQLAELGYNPVLVARRKDRLIELSKEIESKYRVECTVFNADLTIPTECDRVFSYFDDKPLGIVINNAGFGDCGAFLDTDLNRDLSMIDLNIKAVHIITKYAIKKFKKQNGGYLLNVASSAGLFPAGPYMSTYYASKSYVSSLTSAVSMELDENGYSHIHVSALCPGPVDTEFNERANVEFSLPGISAKVCVQEAIDGMIHNHTIIVPSLKMKMAVYGSKYLPRKILIRMVGHQQKKKMN